MASEIAFTIDWQIIIPMMIAGASLLISILQVRRSGKREYVSDLEKTIERAQRALGECERNLKQCGHEKDELRREKYALLERLTSSPSVIPVDSNSGS